MTSIDEHATGPRRRFTAAAGAAWRRIRALPWKDAAEVANKLAAPAVVVVAALLAQSFQASSSVTQLLSAREESDTKIRAEMFKAITDRLVGSQGNSLTPERQAVFTELLALNFHEHIELKPLMSEVDGALWRQWAATKDAAERQRIEEKREEMRSVARRIRARQTAMLYRPYGPAADGDTGWAARWLPVAHAAQPDGRQGEGALRMLGVRFRGGRPGTAEAEDSPCLVDGNPRAFEVPGQNMCVNEPVFENAPDGRAALAITVKRGFADRQSVLLNVKPVRPVEGPGAAGAQPSGSPTGTVAECGGDRPDSPPAGSEGAAGVTAVEFETTWFDFPLTDNTVLASGARYAIFIDHVCTDRRDPSRLEGVRLGLLWFPRDYFPARERPTNHRQFREKLNLPVGD